MLVFCSHSMSADSEGVAASPHNFLLLLFFEKCFYSVPLAGLELMAFLLRQPPEYWDYGYELPHLAETSVFNKISSLTFSSTLKFESHFWGLLLLQVS